MTQLTKFSLYHLMVPLLVLTSLMPMNISIYLVPFQIFIALSLCVSCRRLFLKKIICALLVLIFFTLLFFYNNKVDLKLILLLFSLFLWCCQFDSVLLNQSLSNSFHYALIAFFIISIIQKTFPSHIFYLFAENDGHKHLFEMGYSVYALLGNSTHAAYITVILSSYLIFVDKNKSFNYKYTCFAIALICLILFSNKISIIVFTVVFLFYCYRNSNNRRKVLIIFLALLISLILWLLIFARYYEQWSVVDTDKIHTISHRLNVYEYVLKRTSDTYFWFFGDATFFDSFDLAFDSGISLMFFKLGVIFTFFIYIFIFSVSRNFEMSLVITLPSITQVAFYNSQFIILIFLVVISSGLVKQKNSL